MIRSLYSGVSGLRSHQTRMDVIGNNIANVNTVGYKKARASFADILSMAVRPEAATEPRHYISQVGVGATVAAIQNIYDQGAPQFTGRTLDLAINGNGFFTVKDSLTEKIYYTRNGEFTLDQEGYLVTLDGFKVLDQGGTEVQMQDAQTIIIGKDGTVTYIDSNNAQNTTSIGLANIKNPESLKKIGGNLYAATLNTADYSADNDPINLGAPLSGTTIESGYLEMSNVDLTEEMTNMISTQRGFQANARVITVSDTLLQELVELKR